MLPIEHEVVTFCTDIELIAVTDWIFALLKVTEDHQWFTTLHASFILYNVYFWITLLCVKIAYNKQIYLYEYIFCVDFFHNQASIKAT